MSPVQAVKEKHRWKMPFLLLRALHAASKDGVGQLENFLAAVCSMHLYEHNIRQMPTEECSFTGNAIYSTIICFGLL